MGAARFVLQRFRSGSHVRSYDLTSVPFQISHWGSWLTGSHGVGYSIAPTPAQIDHQGSWLTASHGVGYSITPMPAQICYSEGWLTLGIQLHSGCDTRRFEGVG